MKWIDKEKLHEAVCDVIEEIIFDDGPSEKCLHRIQGILILRDRIEQLMDAEEKE